MVQYPVETQDLSISFWNSMGGIRLVLCSGVKYLSSEIFSNLT